MTTRKLTTALLGAAALLGATNSFAAVTTGSTGNGELVLFAYDAVTGYSYAKGLGVYLDDIVADSAVASTPAGEVDFTLPTLDISGSSYWQDFLAHSSGADNIFYSIMGSDSVGANLQTNPARFVVTTTAIDGLPPNLLNTNIRNGASGISSYFSILNTGLDAFSTTGDELDGLGSTGPFYVEANGGNMSTGLHQDIQLGTTAAFYMYTGSNTSGAATSNGSNPAKVYTLAGVTLSLDGVLSSVSTGGGSEVPLPAGVWLFGSGLLGMLGVGRRRAAKSA